MLRVFYLFIFCHFAGQPFVRVMPDLLATAGQRLTIKCPAGGYPVEIIIWEKGRWWKNLILLT